MCVEKKLCQALNIMPIANPKIVVLKALISLSFGILVDEAVRRVCFRTKRPRSS
jgi:hypothetical protein